MALPKHASQDDFELYLRGGLDPPHASFIESHVRECAACADRLREAAEFAARLAKAGQINYSNQERRSEERIPIDEPASVLLLRPLSLERLAARVSNTSKHGLGLSVPQFLAPGSLTQVRIGKTIILGEVRYCVPEADGFHVGIQIQDITTAPGG